MTSRPEQSLGDLAEDWWLACHDLWMQPIEWFAAWWNAFVIPVSCHRMLHHHAIAHGHPLIVPTAIARDAEPTLFA